MQRMETQEDGTFPKYPAAKTISKADLIQDWSCPLYNVSLKINL